MRAVLLALVIAVPVTARAQTAADSAAIRATALDYIEGWYAGDAERMERSLHPDLAKRIINVDARGRSVLGHQSAMTLVQSTRRGGGRDADAWIDYMHVAKWNGRWVIVNVLWEMRPR
jgi:hypothetical protein